MLGDRAFLVLLLYKKLSSSIVSESQLFESHHINASSNSSILLNHSTLFINDAPRPKTSISGSTTHSNQQRTWVPSIPSLHLFLNAQKNYSRIQNAKLWQPARCYLSLLPLRCSSSSLRSREHHTAGSCVRSMRSSITERTPTTISWGDRRTGLRSMLLILISFQRPSLVSSLAISWKALRLGSGMFVSVP